jgi:hypothetical protein
MFTIVQMWLLVINKRAALYELGLQTRAMVQTDLPAHKDG